MALIGDGKRMGETESLDSFLRKWRARWPEWSIAEVFLPSTERTRIAAWFALQQELTDAAWAGSDPRPGEAKLGWWSEELQGWTQGRRRHPLGLPLQALPLPWTQLAAGLPALLASRERAADIEEALTTLTPYADGVAAISAAMHGPGDAAVGYPVLILAQRALSEDSNGDSVPLHIRAQLGAGASPDTLRRAWMQALMQRWPRSSPLPRAQRIQAALLRERLGRACNGRRSIQPLPRWRTLLVAWRAARA